MKTVVAFEGVEQLAANLAAMPRSVSKSAAMDALYAAAEPMVAVSRRLAPRAPGLPDIADNIESSAGRGGIDSFGDARMPSVVWGPQKGFFYGHFLEWGTVKMSARTFMRPAFDGQAPRSLDILRDRLWVNIQSWLLSRDVS